MVNFPELRVQALPYVPKCWVSLGLHARHRRKSSVWGLQKLITCWWQKLSQKDPKGDVYKGNMLETLLDCMLFVLKLIDSRIPPDTRQAVQNIASFPDALKGRNVLIFVQLRAKEVVGRECFTLTTKNNKHRWLKCWVESALDFQGSPQNQQGYKEQSTFTIAPPKSQEKPWVFQEQKNRFSFAKRSFSASEARLPIQPPSNGANVLCSQMSRQGPALR